MAVLNLGGSSRSAASLLFDQDLGFEQRAKVVFILVGDADLDLLDALVARRWIKIQAVAAGMQIGPAILAFIGKLNLIHHLDFHSAIAAARDQVKARLNATRSALCTRGRLGPSCSVFVLVAGLSILSTHFPSSGI